MKNNALHCSKRLSQTVFVAWSNKKSIEYHGTVVVYNWLESMTQLAEISKWFIFRPHFRFKP